MSARKDRRHPARRPSALAVVAAILFAAGCLSLTDHSQSCTSSGGLLGPGEFSCTGTVGTVEGEGPLSFDGEEDTNLDYRMDLTMSVEAGEMDVHATTSEGGREGGEVSPGSPIRIQATVPSSDEDVSVQLSVKGGEEAEVRGLRYEADFVEAG